jgi:hypothetical protein
MKFVFIKSLLLTLLITTQSAFATRYNVSNLVQDAESIFDYREDAIDLGEFKKLVINENVEVAIAYERLFQAQQQIYQARAAYFPYGVGSITAMYFTSAFSYLILAELITSLPSKIFAVQKQKHLRTAQAFTVEVVKANIKNQTALIYYSFLKQEALLKLAKIELDLLKSNLEGKREEVEFGLATQTDVNNAELSYLVVKDAYLKYQSFFNTAKKSLNTLIGRDFESKPIILQPVGEFVDYSNIGMDIDQMENVAINRSNELKAADWMIRASISNRRSVKWSILSFSGIGFGYGSRVRFSNSQVIESRLRKELIENNIQNSVYTSYTTLENFIGIFKENFALYQTTRNIAVGDIEEFDAGQNVLSKVIRSGRLLLGDLREMVRTHYDVLIKKDDLERLVLGTVESQVYKATSAELKVERNKRNITLEVMAMNELVDIESVKYSFDRNIFKEQVISNSGSNFRLSLRTRLNNTQVVGTAIVTMTNGEVIVKEFDIK